MSSSNSKEVGSGNMESADDSNIERSIEEPRKKRKVMQPRSEVWGHFVRFVNDAGEIKSRCNYCGTELCSDPKKNGTSPLKAHLKTCKKYVPNIDKTQFLLNFQPGTKGVDGECSTLTSWKFDQESIRKGLTHMIIVDELPFKFVENMGFKHFMSLACPRFRIPSRFTVVRDCYAFFLDEKFKLKEFLKNSCEWVSLTTDTWTSIQRINYMCLTAHFIDNDWNLNKRILNFCPISSHKGESIGREIEMCLLEWGIEKVMTITVDNASSNEVAIDYLKGIFTNWGKTVVNGRFLHMRCVAHIINLVVVDGLKEVGESVSRIRAAVRFVRQSPARLKKFKECVEIEKIQSKSLLCLDVSTRWNSTYLMLNAAVKFQRAFERYAHIEPFYKKELEPTDEEIRNGKARGKGKPTYDDWENAKSMVQFLEQFYHLTLRISGSLYVTLNNYLHEISEVDCVLKGLVGSDDIELHTMALKMKEKYEKYWGDIKKINLLIYVAVVLDPRYKLGFVQFAITQLYEGELCLRLKDDIKDALYDLFSEFKNMYSTPSSGKSGSSEKERDAFEVEPKMKVKEQLKKLYKKHMNDIGGGENKSELDRYLAEDVEDDSEDFNILGWWKVNCQRFPILGRVARSVLAIPISTVASESAFSTGGRVLDAFRSSLTPKTAEALICAQDWLRSNSSKVNIEEDLADLENLEKEFSTTTLHDV